MTDICPVCRDRIATVWVPVACDSACEDERCQNEMAEPFEGEHDD